MVLLYCTLNFPPNVNVDESENLIKFVIESHLTFGDWCQWNRRWIHTRDGYNHQPFTCANPMNYKQLLSFWAEILNTTRGTSLPLYAFTLLRPLLKNQVVYRTDFIIALCNNIVKSVISSIYIACILLSRKIVWYVWYEFKFIFEVSNKFPI